MTILEWAGLIVYVLLNVIDWASTADAIYRKKTLGLRECNPIGRFFLKLGRGWFTGYKAAMTIVVIVIMITWETGLFKSIALVLLILAYGWIVIDNIRFLIARDQDRK